MTDALPVREKEWWRRPWWPPVADWGPSAFFKLGLLYLAILLVLPIAYNADWFELESRLGDTIADLIPVGVPLAGALGAVTISLYGVFQHNTNWQKRWNYWHMARPLMGALLGSFGYLIFIATIQSTGVTPAVETTPATTSTTADPDDDAPAPTATTTTLTPVDTTDQDTEQRDLIVYYVIAFVVGYREETFRQLIKRVADALFKPGDGAAGQVALVADRPTGDAPHAVTLAPVSAVKVSTWDLVFGDGESRTNQKGALSSVAHTYNRPGLYLATLTITDDAGNRASASVQITVTGDPAAPPAAAALADAGVEWLLRATTDEERRAIEAELVTETDKFPDDDA